MVVVGDPSPPVNDTRKVTRAGAARFGKWQAKCDSILRLGLRFGFETWGKEKIDLNIIDKETDTATKLHEKIKNGAIFLDTIDTNHK